jgi:transposase
MESTGKYWIPIFNYLENDIDVCLTHPKYVKAIKGKKTDKKDSKWIADLYKFDLVRAPLFLQKISANSVKLQDTFLSWSA